MKPTKIDTKKMELFYYQNVKRMSARDKKAMIDHVEYICSGRYSKLLNGVKFNYNIVGEMPIVNETDEDLIKELFFYIAILKGSPKLKIDYVKMMFAEIEKRGHTFCK